MHPNFSPFVLKQQKQTGALVHLQWTSKVARTIGIGGGELGVDGEQFALDLRVAGHSLFERLWNPRIVLFHDELGHLRPLGARQCLELFDDFLCAHDGNIAQKFLRASRRLSLTRSRVKKGVKL